MKLIFFFTLLFSGFVSAQTPRIHFEAAYAYPEGIAYDSKSDLFYVSSVKTGTVGRVTSQGMYVALYADSTLKSSFGMKVDSARNKIWVCAGDPNYSEYRDSSTYKKMIRIIGIDLVTGRKTDDIDLSGLYPGKHFANDLTLDNEGNLYITDSYSPVIYKIDGSGKASVFARSNWFGATGVGLNGIVWSPQGFLVVANNSTGALFKIDISDPRRVTRIRLQTFFPGADGLLWDKNNHLMLVQNKGVHKIHRLASSDNWQSAVVKESTPAADRFHQPTTLAIRRDKVYTLNSKINELSDPTSPLSKEFSLQEVQFKPLQ